MVYFKKMRGYFGIGVENVSKAMNAGAVMRTAHAFGVCRSHNLSLIHI